MNPTLVYEVKTVLSGAPAPTKLKCAAPLEIASNMLTATAEHQMTATTVVGVLGCDDVEAFRSLVEQIGEQYGLESTVKIQLGCYSVRFSRHPALDTTRHW